MLDWIFLFLTISLCLASILLLSKLSNTSKKKQTLPPGPRFIPILSPILWLRRSLFDLEPILRSLRTKYGPILTLHITSRPAIFVADRDLAHQALIQAGATFADRLAATEANRLLTSNRHNISSPPPSTYGPLWRLLRRNLAAEILHPSRVKLFAPARCWVLDILVANLIAEAKMGDGAVVVMECDTLLVPPVVEMAQRPPVGRCNGLFSLSSALK